MSDPATQTPTPAAPQPAPPPPGMSTQLVALIKMEQRLKEVEADLKTTLEALKIKNDKVTRLEAENIRLKLQRTDKELSAQVDGLRIEVGKKDRELVELRKNLATMKENEAIILRRAAAADEKVKTVQSTMVTMQKAREAAHLEVEKHDRERLEAVRSMVEASDNAKNAQTRIEELTKEIVELKSKQQQPKQQQKK